MCSCPTEATILHADLDSFFASVEQRDDPRLRGRPVIVGGGVVLAASYEAKAFGVHGAMGGAQARRLCPDAVVVPPRFEAYSEASKAVFAVFDDTSPLVEGLSIDEAFLDVRGMRRIAGTPVEIAARLRREVRERVGLPITVGVARTKFLAKVASGVAKPDGLLVVPPDGELGVPAPAAGRAAVGRRAGDGAEAARARDRDGRPGRASSPRTALVGDARPRVGAAAARARAQPRPAAGAGRPAARRSIGAQRALGRRPAVAGRARRVARRAGRPGRRGGCGAARRVCRTVVLRLRFDDFSRATRSHTLAEATAQTPAILAAARELLAAAMPMIERQGLTLRRRRADQPRGRRRAIQLALPFDRQHAARSTPRSTTCASASARRRSRARCCSAATRASRCRCCRTDAR